MATFGKTAVGASNDFIQPGTSNLQAFGPYTLPVNGDLSKLSIYSRGAGGNSKLYGYVFADVAGVPTTYKGQTLPTTGNVLTAWVDLTFSSALSLTAGTYWLGVLISNSSGFIFNSVYDASASGRYYDNTGGGQADGFSGNFPSSPAPGSDTHQFSLYATYTATADGQQPGMKFGFLT